MMRLVAAVQADDKAPPAFMAQVQEQADKLAGLLLDESRRRDAEAKKEAKRPRTDRAAEGDQSVPAAQASDRAVG